MTVVNLHDNVFLWERFVHCLEPVELGTCHMLHIVAADAPEASQACRERLLGLLKRNV